LRVRNAIASGFGSNETLCQTNYHAKRKNGEVQFPGPRRRFLQGTCFKPRAVPDRKQESVHQVVAVFRAGRSEWNRTGLRHAL